MEHTNYAMPSHWFTEIKEAMGDLFEPATDLLGHMMTKGLEYPFGVVKASTMQAAGVLAWLHHRKLTVEELYENPQFFQELRTTMMTYAIGRYPDEPESNQKLINLAMAAERILTGLEEESPWEAIEADMTANPIAA